MVQTYFWATQLMKFIIILVENIKKFNNITFVLKSKFQTFSFSADTFLPSDSWARSSAVYYQDSHEQEHGIPGRRNTAHGEGNGGLYCPVLVTLSIICCCELFVFLEIRFIAQVLNSRIISCHIATFPNYWWLDVSPIINSNLISIKCLIDKRACLLKPHSPCRSW